MTNLELGSRDDQARALNGTANRSIFANTNVLYGLLSTALYALGTGLFQMTVLPSFILAVAGSNFSVGFAEGLQGIANMVGAFPAGYLADKWSRRACIRLGVVLQALACVIFFVAVAVAEPGALHSYVLLCVAFCVQGVCDGIMNGPLVALMDDSCPAGRRSDMETANVVVYETAAGVGPLLGLAVFLWRGDNWSLGSMKVVILLGVAIAFLGVFPMWRMDDKYALGEESEAVHLQENLVNEDGDVGTRLRRSTCFGLINTSNLRVVFFFGELVMMLAAGMTVKFFPVFFQEAADWSPSWVQAVFASLTIFTVGGTFAANSLAKRYGRMQVIIPSTCIGIAGSILLGALREHYHQKGVMVPVFIGRCTGMWSVSALLGSVLADYTPKATRARWKALASITSFGWSGSAAFGGWLIDRFGFSYTFVITGFFQASVIPVWCLLVPLIAKESEILATEAPAESPPGVSLQPCEEAAK